MPINTILALDQEDEVYSFLESVEGVDFSQYVKPIRSNNTHSHDRGMLIKTMLFGYMNGINTLSTLTSLCRTDLRYLYLSNEEKPSVMAFTPNRTNSTETPARASWGRPSADSTPRTFRRSRRPRA